MRKMVEVFRYELSSQLRRASTLIYFAIVLGVCTPFLHMMSSGSRHEGMVLNAPFAVMEVVVFGSMLALLMVAAFAGDAATRDFDARMHSLFYTSPVGKPAYVIGRFLGAFSLSALLLLALPIGTLIATWTPFIPHERVGAFRAIAYLAPYLLFALANAFVATAIAFGLALMTRRTTASYAGAGFLFFFSMICGKLLPTRIGWNAANLLDPLGYTAVQEIWLSTNALQKNAFVPSLHGAL
ncbi:MAG TPA: hypothetical protein VFN10_03725, partial [Thermoanaerobaculia bacterium]|nr:hypothetical protein [Thermoanaerobaculia bacterium]